MKVAIAQLIQAALDQAYPQLELGQAIMVEYPSNEDFGDFATSLPLSLSKLLKQPPMVIAQTLAEAITQLGSQLLSEVTVATPGFINFKLSHNALIKAAQDRVNDIQPITAQPQTIMVEYSSPNIAKPFNVGHLRSTIIGDALANLYAYQGHKVLRDNHLGDWGTQYGKLAYAVEQWGDWEKIKANPIPELFQLYVRINDQAKDDPTLQEEARKYFKRLEDGDPHVRSIWQKLSDLSLKDFNQLYDQFNVHFDTMLGEAFYEPYLKQVVQDCRDAGIAQESQGALIIPFDDPKLQKPPLMILKNNGSSTYATRDLAGIKYRFEHFKLDKLVIEIGNEQEFYFKQIIAASELMGWIKPGQLVHVGHGLFLGSSGKKLSTRKGETVWLKELVEELEQTAQQIVAEKSPDVSPDQQQEIATQVAIGALKYNDLSQNRLSNIVFDKDKALSLDGNSAPYLQYTVARARSVIRQAKILPESAKTQFPEMTAADRALAVNLSRLSDVIQESLNGYLPSTLASYLFTTAQKFNSFYQSEPILKSEPAIRHQRLLLTQATISVLTTGLQLLGIKVPERM